MAAPLPPTTSPYSEKEHTSTAAGSNHPAASPFCICARVARALLQNCSVLVSATSPGSTNYSQGCSIVVLLAQDTDDGDPFGTPPDSTRRTAQLVNARRLRAGRSAGDDRALDTSEVVALLRTVNDRRGVDRRRSRGQLLGWKAGARTLHPRWQFDEVRGETWPGLPAVLEAIGDIASDPHVADSIMSAPRKDLGGASLADLLARERPETVVRLLQAGAEQS
jgi:hypothetical protein